VFAFNGLSATDWTVQPARTGGTGTSISALDAAWVLQTVVGLRQLSYEQRLAGDATGNGTISALDSARILQYKVGLISRLPVAQACNSDWVFVPLPAVVPNQVVIPPQMSLGNYQMGAITYQPLSVRAGGQDFHAIVFGDCTGNWQAGAAGGAGLAKAVAVPDTVRAGRVRPGRAGRWELPLLLNTSEPIYALEVEVEYDAANGRPIRVRRTRSSGGALLAFNAREPGRVRIALASAEPLSAEQKPVAVVTFGGDAHRVDIRSLRSLAYGGGE
jgi:hypothetical protein